MIKLNTSELAEFEAINCDNCIHNRREEDPCFVLGEIAMNGTSTMLYRQDDDYYDDGEEIDCRMRMYSASYENKEEWIKEWIAEARTEEVEEVLIEIEGSYHYDILRKHNKTL